MGKSEESVLVVVRCRPLSSKEVNQELESGSAAKEDKDEDKHRGNGGFYSGEQNTYIVQKILRLLFFMIIEYFLIHTQKLRNYLCHLASL